VGVAAPALSATATSTIKTAGETPPSFCARDEDRSCEEKASKQKIWVAILIPSEPIAGMVVKIWNFRRVADTTRNGR
jgi:hypothetical protein